MQWTAEADQRLLLAILAKHNITVDFGAVAQVLECTPRAVQERLKKLKKDAARSPEDGEKAAQPAVSTSSDDPAKGAKKSRAAKPTKGNQLPKKRAKKGTGDQATSTRKRKSPVVEEEEKATSDKKRKGLVEEEADVKTENELEHGVTDEDVAQVAA